MSKCIEINIKELDEFIKKRQNDYINTVIEEALTKIVNDLSRKEKEIK